MDNHSTLQPIPTVHNAEIIAHLIKMFDAARAVRADIVMAGDVTPEAGPALVLWAGSHNLKVTEDVFPGSEFSPNPYINIECRFEPPGGIYGRVTVINVAKATALDVERHNATHHPVARIDPATVAP